MYKHGWRITLYYIYKAQRWETTTFLQYSEIPLAENLEIHAFSYAKYRKKQQIKNRTYFFPLNP